MAKETRPIKREHNEVTFKGIHVQEMTDFPAYLGHTQSRADMFSGTEEITTGDLVIDENRGIILVTDQPSLKEDVVGTLLVPINENYNIGDTLTFYLKECKIFHGIVSLTNHDIA